MPLKCKDSKESVLYRIQDNDIDHDSIDSLIKKERTKSVQKFNDEIIRVVKSKLSNLKLNNDQYFNALDKYLEGIDYKDKIKIFESLKMISETKFIYGYNEKEELNNNSIYDGDYFRIKTYNKKGCLVTGSYVIWKVAKKNTTKLASCILGAFFKKILNDSIDQSFKDENVLNEIIRDKVERTFKNNSIAIAIINIVNSLIRDDDVSLEEIRKITLLKSLNSFVTFPAGLACKSISKRILNS